MTTVSLEKNEPPFFLGFFFASSSLKAKSALRFILTHFKLRRKAGRVNIRQARENGPGIFIIALITLWGKQGKGGGAGAGGGEGIL